jgi:ribosome-associated protein YbcJ (S4-like RNA binding protein)
VLQSFRIFEPRKIDFGFLTLQTVLDNMLCHHGGNEFKIEHIGKERLLRNGELENRRNASVEAAAVAQFVRNPRQQPDNNNRRDNGPHEQGQMIQQQEAV